MLKVVEYLVDYGQDKLKEEFGIVIKKYPNFSIYNYSQIDSPKHHTIVKECRGLILSNENYVVLCRSFDRFLNLGENEETIENINDYKVLSKEDGSLINVWYNHFEKQWQCSTRGTAYAESTCNTGRKFSDIIWYDIFKGEFNECFKTTNKNLTFIFELCGPENRVVKIYETPVMFLLGIRNNLTGDFFDYEMLKFSYGLSFIFNNNIDLVKVHNFESTETLKQATEGLKNLDEGFVVWNEETGHRVKIKSSTYIQMHHLKDNGIINPKRILEVVRKEEQDEVLSVFPEYKQYFQSIIEGYEWFKHRVKAVWNESKSIQDQKMFALQVKDYSFSGILFSMKKD
jgi:T4 RnlA family RNA ligase